MLEPTCPPILFRKERILTALRYFDYDWFHMAETELRHLNNRGSFIFGLQFSFDFKISLEDEEKVEFTKFVELVADLEEYFNAYEIKIMKNVKSIPYNDSAAEHYVHSLERYILCSNNDWGGPFLWEKD